MQTWHTPCPHTFVMHTAYLEYTTKKGPYTQPFEKINILFTIFSFYALSCRSFAALAVGNHVEDNRHQKHAAFYHILPGIADPHNGHTHVDDAQKERTA